MKAKFEIAFFQHGRSFRVCRRQVFTILCFGRQRIPGANVPNHDGTGSVVSFRDNALEIEVRDRVVFHLHREPLVRRIQRGALGNRPRFQHAFHLKTKVVVEASSAMTLHYKTVAFALVELWGRLWSFREAPLAFVFLKSHEPILIGELRAWYTGGRPTRSRSGRAGRQCREWILRSTRRRLRPARERSARAASGSTEQI